MSNIKNPGEALETPTSKQEQLLDVQLAEAKLSLVEKQDALAKKIEEERQKKAVQASGAKAMAQRQEQQKLAQDNCPHIKPNFQPSIGGQRDHQGDYNWICLYCGKEWKNQELPPRLRIDMQLVGGPTV